MRDNFRKDLKYNFCIANVVLFDGLCCGLPCRGALHYVLKQKESVQ